MQTDLEQAPMQAARSASKYALTDQTTVTIEFLAYDEAGTLLTYAETTNRMTNGAGMDFLSVGTFDLETLKAVKLNTFYESNRRFTVEVDMLRTHPRQGIMVHWNTESTGYSTYLLDNLGRGFSSSQVVILNEQLAFDARRHYMQAQMTKSGLQRSSALTDLDRMVEHCYDELAAARGRAIRGETAQRCLDFVSRSMELMLREYGMQRARALADSSAKWGVTIIPGGEETLAQDLNKIDRLVELFAPEHRWARFVMDGTNTADYPRISEVLAHAYANGVQTMGQLFDSNSQAEIPLARFKTLVRRTLAHEGFQKFSAWEVGNEVNGGWLGPDMSRKIEFAAAQVRDAYPDKPICLTLYWYSMQDTRESSLFNWIDANITRSIRDTIDCITTSIYVDQQPLGFLWDMVQSKVSELFPGKDVMVGEMGFIDPTERYVFREGRAEWSNERAAIKFINSRYPAAFATPRSVGGGFWWYYDVEMAPAESPLWKALRSVYCEANADFCSVPPAQRQL